ncbi:PAS domain-containing protein [Falsiroseomonas sp. HW251]|uniref:PAS domain-containing protein n=1 Tax=Falsiroseomonas sp. HW251 TaxID=3390998 RepID=UPI003D3241DD
MSKDAAAAPAGRWFALSLLGFALLAAALFVAATAADREATLAQGRTTAVNTAALLAGHADRTLRVAQITAIRAEALVQREGQGAIGPGLHEALRALAADAPEIGVLVLLGPDGRVAAASLMRDPPPIDLSDRDFFAAIRGGATEALSPLVRARPFDVWSFTLNRAIREDGRLIGVVHVALHAEDFARIGEQLSLGRAAEFRLLRRDGETTMRWPLPASLPLPPAPRREGAEGVVEETGPDGVLRLVAWRAAPTMPVVAEAALSLDEVLAPFRRRLLRNALIFGLSVVLAGVLARAALRAGRREAEARRAVQERGMALTAALTERLSLLASLQEGEARLRLAQEGGGLGLWDLDLASRRLVLIGEVFARWGLSVRAARGMRAVPLRAVRRALHRDDRAAVIAAFRAALRDGVPFAAEFRLAGAVPARWIGVRAEPRAGADGRPARLLGIALEVTAQHQAQAALEEARATLARRVAERTSALAEANARLREGEARFRGLFNATFQFIGLLSPDGTVVEANAAMLRLGGAQEADVVGRPYWDAPWWPEDGATQALLREAIAEAAAGRFARRDTAMRDAGGAPVTVDFSVTPVRDEDGLVSLLVAEARDVSALKAAQALLHEAQKMDTLGQLTGGVAHDFNNLLMAVLANLAIARKRAGESATEGRSTEVARYIDAAIQAAERGATLTQRLLAFARRQDLKPAVVDLRALLLGLEALLRRSAGPLVTLEIDAPEGLPPAHVDPHALELALVNLAVNARDAMPEGGVFAMRLALAEGAAPGRLSPGRWLIVAVSDTGIGMDEATLARAVEPFFTTKGPGRGTGLGLSMVDGLAAQSGGALVLDSAPGCGTTATLWLPVSPVGLLPAEPRVAPMPAATGRGAVLVVDDEDLVLESTAAMLEELGYEPVPAEGGEAALELLAARGDIVAVVTDHAMPGMTGMALAARIRASRPGLPVILATGHVGAWADQPDAPPRLMKPYDLGQLADALQGVFRKAAE